MSHSRFQGGSSANKTLQYVVQGENNVIDPKRQKNNLLDNLWLNKTQIKLPIM